MKVQFNNLYYFHKNLEKKLINTFTRHLKKSDFIENNRKEYNVHNQKRTVGKSLAHKIFSKNQIEDEEEINPVNKYEYINKNILNREDLAEDYMRSDDIEMIKTDIPERIQLKFGDKDK